MLARTVLLFVVLTSSARAAAFDDLKQNLAECLRFELSDGGGSRGPVAARAARSCSEQIEALDRADGRRLRGDQGLSPSTWSVIRGVLGRGAGAR
ncbi:hypothetical protein [Methylobacterium haplocladii]|uniref:Uncharacterized protein n=1 Tax=Methylobacterium haplocladii TaxID=1176176 RepID=A0A512IPD0_9HYPH|nr:hypothetical protein [Methylobacterium haplocladii]GEO99540.1 hypothetical protein MHA02_19280 [Methylobacterium haplocladii]GJD83683.1 hypothetical protein HPGCJGGD_1553 [Methylobacterium haplocladii]GLS60836.1 hypothetical protein GCM10007887_35250 [Methylobacterium haplocladii]